MPSFLYEANHVSAAGDRHSLSDADSDSCSSSSFISCMSSPASNEESITYFFECCQAGNVWAVNIFLQNYSFPDRRDEYLNYALFLAYKHDRFVLFDVLLNFGANPNIRNIEGNFLLYYVKGPCLDLLLAHPSTDVNQATDGYGETRLMKEVSKANDTFIIEKLLKHPDIDVNHQNHVGNSAIFYMYHSVPNNGPWRSIMKLLVQNLNLDVSIKNDRGQNIKEILRYFSDEAYDLFKYNLVLRQEIQEEALQIFEQDFLKWPEGLFETYVRPFFDN